MIKYYIIEKLPLCPDCGSKIRIFLDRDEICHHQTVSYYCGASYIYFVKDNELLKRNNCTGQILNNKKKINLALAKSYNAMLI